MTYVILLFGFVFYYLNSYFVFCTKQRDEHHKDPICDMGVVCSGQKGEDIPSHYELLAKSVSGKLSCFILHKM